MSNPGWGGKNSKTIPGAGIPSKGKVSLDIEQFDTLIKQQGVRVKVHRTLLCPNVKSIDGAEHEIDCEICSNGFVDTNPLETMAFIQSQNMDKPHQPEGLIDDNQVYATFLTGVELQYFTLVELCDFTEAFYERIKRQQGAVDHLKYKATCINVAIDSKGKQFYQGNDFSITKDGSLKWKANKGPDRGDIYSVHYDCAIQFRAVRAAHVNRFLQESNKSSEINMRKVQEQWVLSKEYLVNRVDSITGERLENKIRDPDLDDDIL